MNSILTYNDTDGFINLYRQLKENEGKLYNDEELAKLPEIKRTGINRQEWANRKNSFNRLLHYLKQKRDRLHILEVGCGDGWLAAQLASCTKNKVTGIDIDSMAIEQAKRVFGIKDNLEYIQFDFNNEYFEDKRFDIVIMSASIQHFNSFKKTIATAMEHLTLQGEIHIIEAVLYRQDEIAAAKEQTVNYLQTMGLEKMSAFFFYHSIDELKKFNHTILYDPSFWINRLLHNGNPFYHVVIKNRYQ